MDSATGSVVIAVAGSEGRLASAITGMSGFSCWEVRDSCWEADVSCCPAAGAAACWAAFVPWERIYWAASPAWAPAAISLEKPSGTFGEGLSW